MLGAVAGSVAVATLAAGCTQAPRSCTANLVLDHFELHVSVPDAAGDSVRLCLPGACSEAVGAGADGQVVGRFTTLSLDSSGGGGWTAAVDRGPDPAAVEVRVVHGARTIAARTVPLSWHRTATADGCHVWMSAGDVRLAIG